MGDAKQSVQYNLENVRTEVVDASLRVAAVVGSVAYLLSLTRAFSSGFHYSFIFDFVVILALVVVAIHRERITNNFKASVVIALLLLFSLADATVYGLFSSGRIYLLLVPFFAFLFYSLRISLIVFSVSLISFAGIGFLHWNGTLAIPEAYEPGIYVLRMYPWVINAIHMAIVALIMVLVTRKFIGTFQFFMKQLQQTNRLISERERNYREIFNASSDAIFVHHPQTGVILDVNNAVSSIFGFNESEIIGQSIGALCSDESPFDEKQALEFVAEAAKHGFVKFDWKARNNDDEIFWAEVILKKANIAGEERILAMVRDITHKKNTEIELDAYRYNLEKLVQERTEELEAANEELMSANEELQAQQDVMIETLDSLHKTQSQLILSEKKASLGILASGVAHEINNPLNFIAGGVMALENYVHDHMAPHMSELDPLLKGINEGIRRANNIVVALNQYTRIGEGEYPVPCNIHEIIDRGLGILASHISDGIRIEKKYARLGRELTAKQSQLLQAFVNILTNSIQAIENEGEISITTCEDMTGLIVEIKDNGCGIAPEHLLRVTDPFYTTRAPGEGTGLGLSIAASIVRDHNGEIKVESEPTGGTRVILTLPYA